MTANELADELTKMFRGEEYDRLIHEIPDMLRQQAKEIEELNQHIMFLKDKAVMVDNSDVYYAFQPLFGEDMAEASKKITNMLRNMVNEEFEKELKKASEK